MGHAQPTLLADDDDVRITSWSFGQGDSTGQHRHELDYVVVPVTGGTFAVTGTDGKVGEMTQEAGVPYARRAGVLHDVTSTSGGRVVFIEIEFKQGLESVRLP